MPPKPKSSKAGSAKPNVGVPSRAVAPQSGSDLRITEPAARYFKNELARYLAEHR